MDFNDWSNVILYSCSFWTEDHDSSTPDFLNSMEIVVHVL